MDLFTVIILACVAGAGTGYFARVFKQQRESEKLLKMDYQWYARCHSDFVVSYGIRCWSCGMGRMMKRQVFTADRGKRLPLPAVVAVFCEGCGKVMYYEATERSETLH